MILEVKAPNPGESITEVEIASWAVSSGDYVDKDMEIGEIESDKATISLVAEESGKLEIIVKAGETIDVGTLIANIDTSAKRPAGTVAAKTEPKVKETVDKKETEKSDSPKASIDAQYKDVKVTPLAQELIDENDLNIEDIISGLRRIKKDDVKAVLSQKDNNPTNLITEERKFSRETEIKKMSSLRRKLSQRLVAVKNETAMLTTFNEADMSTIISIRKQFQDKFVEKHGVKVGFMTFFLKAAAEALISFPEVNASIDNDQIIYHDYSDIGIAVQTPKGLMVPVIRNAETSTFAEIELKIRDYATKGQANKISLEETMGGTFTISNGGTFGSLLSSPILNPPQSAILGMHNIQERPVAINGKVEIRPMMYLALSYDHRMIDGMSAVKFLVKVKEFVESPHMLLTKSEDPMKILLEL